MQIVTSETALKKTLREAKRHRRSLMLNNGCLIIFSKGGTSHLDPELLFVIPCSVATRKSRVVIFFPLKQKTFGKKHLHFLKPDYREADAERIQCMCLGGKRL